MQTYKVIYLFSWSGDAYELGEVVYKKPTEKYHQKKCDTQEAIAFKFDADDIDSLKDKLYVYEQDGSILSKFREVTLDSDIYIEYVLIYDSKGAEVFRKSNYSSYANGYFENDPYIFEDDEEDPLNYKSGFE